jgi:hypothetical protein
MYRQAWSLGEKKLVAMMIAVNWRIWLGPAEWLPATISGRRRRSLSMKLARKNALNLAMGVVAAAALIVGCNSNGSAVGLSPTSQTSYSRLHSIRRQDMVSTTVKIFNQENGTLTGTATIPSCWTVSPSPIPTISASPGTVDLTETYDTTCAAHSPVSLNYTLFSDYTCVFSTNINASGTADTFTYTQTALGPEDNCFATAKPNGTGKFIYELILGANRHYASNPKLR